MEASPSRSIPNCVILAVPWIASTVRAFSSWMPGTFTTKPRPFGP